MFPAFKIGISNIYESVVNKDTLSTIVIVALPIVSRPIILNYYYFFKILKIK